MQSQPFRFNTIYHSRIWGGRKFRTLLGRTLPDNADNYAEAWEVCDRPGAVSIVKEGYWEGVSLHELWTRHRRLIFGPGYEQHPRFPLICKILDASDKLSVQVHPPAQTAAKWQGEVKNEVWYVLHAEPNACLYGGLTHTCSPEHVRAAAENGKLESLLKVIQLRDGEHLYIPSGMLHAINGGYLIAEVQQNSDTTYRLYDWARTDAYGNSRELHPEQAIDSYREFLELSARPEYLTSPQEFAAVKVELSPGQSFTQKEPERFAIFAVIRGKVLWNETDAQMGDFILSPAHAAPVRAGEDGAMILVITAAAADGMTNGEK